MNLLKAIQANKNVRRIFGKRELVIIEKQLKGVVLTPSEKTRLSRDIRKKLEAVAALAPFTQEFRLKHGSIVHECIIDAKEAILESAYFQRIKRIVLFGSAATRQLTLGSDIDIAVEFTSITKKEAFRFQLDILKKLNDNLDIKVYNILPQKIKREIDTKGKMLYEHKNKRQNR